MKQYSADFIGTFWFVLGGCGGAVLASAFPGVGIGLHGVSLALGLTVVTLFCDWPHLWLPPESSGLNWIVDGAAVSQ